MFLHVSVILFTGRGGSVSVHAGIYIPPGADPPGEQCMLADTGNKRAVSILLECILVIHFFKKYFWRTSVLFVRPLIPLFWTSGDVCPGFSSQGGSSCLHASSLAHNRILRFIFGATPADFLAVSMAAKPFSPTYLRTSTGGTLYRLSYAGSAYFHTLKIGTKQGSFIIRPRNMK